MGGKVTGNPVKESIMKSELKSTLCLLASLTMAVAVPFIGFGFLLLGESYALVGWLALLVWGALAFWMGRLSELYLIEPYVKGYK